MKEKITKIVGEFNDAKVFTLDIEELAKNQVLEICNEQIFEDSKIRIMPDVHAGNGCVIGTTMTIKDKVVPNLVGCDISCGIFVIKLKDKEIDFELLDNVINEFIPNGSMKSEKEHKDSDLIDFDGLVCKNQINIIGAKKSIGTLGGGNHFIEVNIDNNGDLYLVVHSGSRGLGNDIAEFYQEKALKVRTTRPKELKDILIAKLIAEGRHKDIEKELKNMPKIIINKDLAYLDGKDFDDYINDVKIAQNYADLNRKSILNTIVEKMNLTKDCEFSTIHNYIDTDKMILRKGAISAKLGEISIIPINMRDGSLLCIGKGNEDWNCSAPHGAGRVMSRSVAKESVSLDDFKATMEGIWTTSVSESTVDESPFAYKKMDNIIENTKDTLDVISILKPLYNFKSTQKQKDYANAKQIMREFLNYK